MASPETPAAGGGRVARIHVLAIAFALAHCNPDLGPPLSPIEHKDGPSCADAEKHLRELGCTTEANTGGGFGAFCERMAEKAVDQHPACVARITKCAQFNDASRGCP